MSDGKQGEGRDIPADRREIPRSGSPLTPGIKGGWTAVWYHCEECGYRERAMSDGLLAREYCPLDGAVLVAYKAEQE